MIDGPYDNPLPDEAPDSDFRLAPLPPEAIPTAFDPPAPAPLDLGVSPHQAPLQFSLGQLLVWMAIVSAGLSGLVWLRPDVFAGVCGCLTVASLVFTSVSKPDSLARLVYHALLTMYLIALVIAVVNHAR